MSQTFSSGTEAQDPDPLEHLHHAVEHLADALRRVNLQLLNDADAVDVMMTLEAAGRAVDAAGIASTPTG